MPPRFPEASRNGSEYIEEVDQDLGDIEEEVFGYDEDEDDFDDDDYDDDEEFYELECEACGMHSR